jgi:hypothetical protein
MSLPDYAGGNYEFYIAVWLVRHGEINRKDAITLYEEDNNCISGDADKNGKVSLYNDAGNPWYGEIKSVQQ